mmetsp:Transcript_54627/g.163240  ORF Transcript_54627/g.163240 Transcript_54627/m.163240 type:complete len:736 (-) Transcript_54627:399-2606(-)
MPPDAASDDAAAVAADAASSLPPPPPKRPTRQHGVKGVYHGGDWLDIEDLGNKFDPDDATKSCSGCANLRTESCPRSKSRNDASITKDGMEYDVIVVGAGCVGSSVARELSRYKLSVLLVEAADDVSQGATKGNSGIVHAGYDDAPGSVRAKYCWRGNQMFSRLDRELRFGYQRNGSLVLAFNEDEMKVLDGLLKKGETNGVERLRIIDQKELKELEPAVHPEAIGALLAPDAGNVIPYEFAVALAENAVDNGVEVRIRREVTSITSLQDNGSQKFELNVRHWEPKEYLDAHKPGSALKSRSPVQKMAFYSICFSTAVAMGMGIYMILDPNVGSQATQQSLYSVLALLITGVMAAYNFFSGTAKPATDKIPFAQLAKKVPQPKGDGGKKVAVEDMLTGGSGSWNAVKGDTVAMETVRAKYVVNAAGGASDKIASMIGDDSFQIKPRLGDYLLLNRNQGHLTTRTLFPCPHPKLGKGVLVQTTLWGNLILGPTARDVNNPDAADMSDASVQEYILSKCRRLVPYFDPRETFHAFCGARAKNSTGDWIVRPSENDGRFIHAAGIDSPGLAGSPAVAVEVVNLLKGAGLPLVKDPTFNPNRAPIITPKNGMRGLKMGPLGKNDAKSPRDVADIKRMASNVVCKCEKVTELEIVRAVHRSLPIDSTQAIRKRTRAGMGHCQGEIENYDCETRVRAIVARENGVSTNEEGGRPWPATSTLTRRWIDEGEKDTLKERMMVG